MNPKEKLASYANRVSQALAKSDFDMLASIGQCILSTKQTGASIYTIGNGGSHTTASHLSNDLFKGCRVHGREGFKAICLGDLSAIFTCLANDFSYDVVYEIMLRTYAKAGDVLIAFSGSGNSPNIVNAAKTAKEMGVTVIGFGGRDGGQMKDYCDYLILAPTDSMEELEDIHLIYEHDLVTYLRDELSDMFDIETIRYVPVGKVFHSALFDFDGTLSLIREGWQDIMIPYFTDEIAKTPNNDNAKECAAEFVHRLTGKQTIFQCIYLAEEIERRGGTPLSPGEYKAEYLRRLMVHINDRREALLNGADPEKYMVKGSLSLLKTLKDRDIKLYLASGTDECDVIDEAQMLGIAHYFDGAIYGAKDDDTDCSKEIIIRQILANNEINADQLLSFGDGYIEIYLTKEAGGYPVAVATDESRGYGIDESKRQRLIESGAAMVIPNYENIEQLCKALLQ